MQWPLQFMESVIGLAAVAIVIPWLIPPTRRGVLVGVFAALAATAFWMSYENHLAAIAQTRRSRPVA